MPRTLDDEQTRADAAQALAQVEEERAAAKVNAAVELLQKRAAERRERLSAYRRLVERSAAQGGELGQADVGELVELVEKLDLTVEQFEADVAAVGAAVEIERQIAGLLDEQLEHARVQAAAEARIKELAAEWRPRDAAWAEAREVWSRDTAAARRQADQALQARDRLSRKHSELETRLVVHRGGNERVWGRI